MNKNFVWFTAVLFVFLLLIFIFLGEREDMDHVVEASPEELAVREAGTSFVNDFIAMAPPSEDLEAKERVMSKLSNKALNEIGDDSPERDIALFFGVQDVPDRGFDIEEVLLEGDDSAVLKVKLDYSGGSAYKSINMVKEDGKWKVDSVEKRIGGEFREIGNITRDNPGYPDGVWHLLYERPGEPALNEPLVFTNKSTCVAGGETGICDSDRFEVGAKVEIKGKIKDEGVEVETLKFLE